MLAYLITTRKLCTKPLKLAASCAGHEILQILEICTIDMSQYTTSVLKPILMRISISYVSMKLEMRVLKNSVVL